MLPAEVAQLVEQWSEEPCVAGSSPALGTEGFAGISVIGRFKQRPSTLRPFRIPAGRLRQSRNEDREPFADAAGRHVLGWLTHS